jgi:uncharacterized damage-inducible protein DinB
MARSEPGFEADERTMLLGWLDYHRATILLKADGLTDDQARKRLGPSGLTILGLVRHLAEVERWWFRMVFAGETITTIWCDDDVERDFNVTADDTLAEAIDSYREECERANRIIEAAALDDLAAGSAERPGVHPSMRWIVTHMIEETARHNGHADLIRESIDGTTGD